MPGIQLNDHRDNKFPKYVYAKNPLVDVFKERSSGKKAKVAKLFMGEWMKILDEDIPESGRIHVRYRGGKGYVRPRDVSWDRHLEIFFIDVYQGDSILIQTPDDRRILVDGGQDDSAHNFISTKYNLMEEENYIDLDAVVATHSDSDHTRGLIRILENPKILVKRFYHNGLFRRKDKSLDPGRKADGLVFGLEDDPGIDADPELAPLMKKVFAAVKKAEDRMIPTFETMKGIERWQNRISIPEEGFICKRLDAALGYLPPYDNPGKMFRIKVLWPFAGERGGELCYPFYGDVGKTVNGNSVVLMLEYGSQEDPKRILLTGDLNTQSMNGIIQHYEEMGVDPENVLQAGVYKAAHHGSQHFSVPFLKSVQPDAAVISSGDNRYDVHGHPRAVLMGTITRYSATVKPAVFSTELAACYRPLSKTEMKKSVTGKGQLYERSIAGIVHLRSDGDQLFMGTVFGRKPLKDPHANTRWKWDVWPEA